MRIRKGIVFWILGVFAFLGVVSIFVLCSGRNTLSRHHLRGTQTFEIEYFWDNGIKRFHILNKTTEREEKDPEIIELGRKELDNVLPAHLLKSGLRKAKGRLVMKLIGSEKPFLVEISLPEPPEDPDRTTLMRAAQEGDSIAVSRLLSSKADVNAKDQLGMTALMLGAQSRNPEVVRILLKNGADPNIMTAQGIGALEAATLVDCAECVELLLEAGAHPNVVDGEGYTPLDRAKDRDNGKIIALLQRALRQH